MKSRKRPPVIDVTPTEVVEAPCASTLEVPWTGHFAADVAIADEPYPAICARHGVTENEWGLLTKDPEFMGAVEGLRSAMRRDGGSFKVKSRALAEKLLKRFEEMIYSDDVAASVKADLMKYAVKMAGLDASAEQRAASGGQPLQINIMLG